MLIKFHNLESKALIIIQIKISRMKVVVVSIVVIVVVNKY